MKTSSIIVFLVLLTGGAVRADRWDKYVPPNERKQTTKSTARVIAPGFGANERAIVSWVTDRLARAIVSSVVDKQRLQPDDAERKYRELRPGDKYTFIVRVFFVAESRRPFGPHKTRDLLNPIESSTIFLQRSDDNSNFARGTAVQTEFDLNDGPTDYNSSYLVTFQKTSDKGQPVIKSLDDTIELQMEIAGKKVTAKYPLKGLVTSLGEL